ncbi:hypothetical protein OB959_01625 [Aeromonas bestiarum]|uniref:Uncharacterized protein n=1 Tax=Aeromonas bestiarum TaxID=105751 RepID=A0AAW7HUV3_9GAMM|nr:hypothetical protein [Aeromonas bestiarum]MDM5138500.1 hypothetical protein [Aeromonas bestiarum]
MLTDPNKQAAFERALHQISQLKASQPAGLSVSTADPRAGFRCKSIERERPRDVYWAQCPYVGISISMKDVK